MNQSEKEDDNPIFSFTLIDKKREEDLDKARVILEKIVAREMDRRQFFRIVSVANVVSGSAEVEV